MTEEWDLKAKNMKGWALVDIIDGDGVEIKKRKL